MTETPETPAAFDYAALAKAIADEKESRKEKEEEKSDKEMEKTLDDLTKNIQSFSEKLEDVSKRLSRIEDIQIEKSIGFEVVDGKIRAITGEEFMKKTVEWTPTTTEERTCDNTPIDPRIARRGFVA